MVERMGASFVYGTVEETGAAGIDVVKAFLAANAILEGKEHSIKLSSLDQPNSTKVHLESLMQLTSALDEMTLWLLERRNRKLTLSELIERYKPNFRELLRSTETFGNIVEHNQYKNRFNALRDQGLPVDLAHIVTSFYYAAAHLEVAEIALLSNTSPTNVSRLYGTLSATLHLSAIVKKADEIVTFDRWDDLAVRATVKELRNSIGELTHRIIIEEQDASQQAMNAFFHSRLESIEQYQRSLREFEHKPMNVATLIVISNQLKAIISKRAARV
ncbi:hypothetical protein BVY02_01725 [bacterium J17]|nr:hypothetical protein BVY02_01725 [bacterium J17]